MARAGHLVHTDYQPNLVGDHNRAIGGMQAGGDCIDDCDVLRSAALPEIFDQVRARSLVASSVGVAADGQQSKLGVTTP